MEIFDPYNHALASLAIWGLLVVVLAMLSTRGRNAEDRADCGKPKRDYANKWYRTERAFANAIETSPAFLATTLAAILSGASPLIVNILASVFLLARLAMAYVHIQTENQNMRSLTFAIGWLMTVLMGLTALIAVFL